jgi:hypothetical protein
MTEITNINSSAIETVNLIDSQEQIQIKFHKSPTFYTYNVTNDYQLYSNSIAARIQIKNDCPEWDSSIGSYINHLIQDNILVLA